MIVVSLTLRATSRAGEYVDFDSLDRLEKIRELCEDLNERANENLLGFEVEVVEAREARCVYEGFLPAVAPGVWWEKPLRQCPETATDVVHGSELCAAHAKGARRLLAALGRAS